jgi:hypothetical protein
MRTLIPIFLAAAAACHGSVLTMSVVPDTLIGYPGDTVKFFGSLTNTTGSEVFINNYGVLFPLGGVDGTPFLINAPLSLPGSQSSATFEFLDITIPLGQGPGTYDGVFTILGGGPNDFNNVGTADFHVTVNSLSPEPASTLLVGLGLAGASLLARRNRLRQASRN